METYMEINKETAHRLWVQQFGKRQKAIDFAGREIAKAAYNDRSSDFGWNVDHILPQSRGGKTADHNLVCCHILTNDEKADRFPCFKANQRAFEIQKRQNHYEIIAKSAGEKMKREQVGRAVNFLDAAQGIAFWKKCKSSDIGVSVGYVRVYVKFSDGGIQLLKRYKQFLEKLFETEFVFVDRSNYSFLSFSTQIYREVVFTVLIHPISSAENLLHDCVILNTYTDYFIQKFGFEDIRIVCGVKEHEEDPCMSLNHLRDIDQNHRRFSEPLVIDHLVKETTSAADVQIGRCFSTTTGSEGNFYPYNYICKELAKDLEKLI